jgi:hypothetical protein
LIGKTVAQAAPARVSRGMGLPTVVPSVLSGGEGDHRPCGELDGAVPFVVASRHANGAVAVATLGRYNDTLGYCTPLADVGLEWPDDERAMADADAAAAAAAAAGGGGLSASPAGQLVGIFGHFGSLTLTLPSRWSVSQVLPTCAHSVAVFLNREPWHVTTAAVVPSRVRPMQVLAQDLLATAAQNISTRVHLLQGNVVRIDGGVIDEVGTAARASGDVSEPGLVLSLRLEGWRQVDELA